MVKGAKQIIVPKCPHCKRAGPMTLVVSTTFKFSEEGSLVIECLGCKKTTMLGDFFSNLLEFRQRIDVVEVKQ